MPRCSCYHNRVKMKPAQRLLEDEIQHRDQSEKSCEVMCEALAEPMATEVRSAQCGRLFQTERLQV